MLTDIVIGQYFPGNSLLHRMDPRSKILLLLVLIAVIFLADTAAAYALLVAFALGAALVSRLPLAVLLRSLKPLWWILLFTFMIHAFTTGGAVIWQYGVLTLTVEGLRQAVFISLRLILLILLSSLLTFTTSPIVLTDGLETLLTPFRRFGLPAHELAMMMTIALRFIPTLLEETDKIMKAQQSRGADFRSGNIVRRVKSMLPVLVPLFISAFRRADDLAVAMEARCYRGGEGRTHLRALVFTRADYQAAAACLCLAGALAYLRLGGV